MFSWQSLASCASLCWHNTALNSRPEREQGGKHFPADSSPVNPHFIILGDILLLWIAMHPSEDLIASFWRSNWNQLSFQILIHGEELIHNILHTKFIALNSLMNSWHEFIYDFIALKSRAWFHFSMNSFELGHMISLMSVVLRVLATGKRVLKPPQTCSWAWLDPHPEIFHGGMVFFCLSSGATCTGNCS